MQVLLHAASEIAIALLVHLNPVLNAPAVLLLLPHLVQHLLDLSDFPPEGVTVFLVDADHKRVGVVDAERLAIIDIHIQIIG